MLKKNILNEFDVTVVLDGNGYSGQKIFVECIVDNKKKYFYKITTKFNNLDLDCVEEYFSKEFIEGVKGFGKHIISNEKFHLVINDKKKSFELITYDNSLFIDGYLFINKNK